MGLSFITNTFPGELVIHGIPIANRDISNTNIAPPEALPEDLPPAVLNDIFHAHHQHVMITERQSLEDAQVLRDAQRRADDAQMMMRDAQAMRDGQVMALALQIDEDRHAMMATAARDSRLTRNSNKDFAEWRCLREQEV